MADLTVLRDWDDPWQPPSMIEYANPPEMEPTGALSEPVTPGDWWVYEMFDGW